MKNLKFDVGFDVGFDFGWLKVRICLQSGNKRVYSRVFTTLNAVMYCPNIAFQIHPPLLRIFNMATSDGPHLTFLISRRRSPRSRNLRPSTKNPFQWQLQFSRNIRCHPTTRWCKVSKRTELGSNATPPPPQRRLWLPLASMARLLKPFRWNLTRLRLWSSLTWKGQRVSQQVRNCKETLEPDVPDLILGGRPLWGRDILQSREACLKYELSPSSNRS